ncbi:MAG TPA: acetylxylan esterase [Burkholderiales bacterium]|nr:acetylxylan esterase [Burkholderiales bacterium]
MTRRQWLQVCAASAAAAQDNAPADYPGVKYRDYSRVLPDYLRRIAQECYERRNAEVAKLKTTDAIRKRQQWSRDTFWRLIGGKLERTPVNVRVTGSFERDKYKVENLIYESRPNFHITANLYIPKTARPPYPGVLFQMGHSVNGKAGASYQRACQALAQLGYLVLGFDPQGQGERIYYPDASGLKTRQDGPDGEHTYAGMQLLLTGDTSTRIQTWDAVRSLDVLASHPLVDPKRLASTGQSGGGTLTMFLVAVDDRLVAAAVCSGNTENFASGDWNPPGPVDDAEQDFPGSGPLGWDRWDTMYPFAPKPLLISVSHKDFFGTYSPRYISNGWEEFKKLRSAYEVLGKPDHIKWDGTGLPHGLSYDTRLFIYNWFARWLKGDSQEITEEPPTVVEKDQVLWATKSGNVIRELNGETPFRMNRTRAAGMKAAGRTLLSIAAPKIEVQRFAAEPLRGAQVTPLDILVEPGVYMPAWLYEPRPAASVKGSLVLLQASRLTNFREEELFHQLALRGFRVLIPDLRGTGDVTPEFGRAAARHARGHANEESWAWASLILGRPLLAQRALDVRAAVHAVGEDATVAAIGKMTVPALVAAAAEPRIRTLYLADGLASFRSVVENETYDAAFANFVPGVLNRADLPDIASTIAPRKIVLAGTLDGAGRKMPVAEVRKLYPDTRSVQIEADAAWTAERLANA